MGLIRFTLCTTLVMTIGCSGIGIAQQIKIPAELWEKTEGEGSVSVIVSLKLTTEPESKLGPEEKVQQRARIASIQQELQAELVGTRHRIRTEQPKTVPILLLEVGRDALSVLATVIHRGQGRRR